MAYAPARTPPDPWSTGIMAGASIAKSALDDQTNQTQNNTYSAGYDNSGWSINIGDGATQSTSATRSNSALGLGSLLDNPVVLLALCAAVYLVLKKR